ncbi:MAG: hypothetical protein KBS96_05960 [Lachnospiraceae bacterium]|nr:hypothetical protein [Candidatus Colinaster scatohippi]
MSKKIDNMDIEILDENDIFAGDEAGSETFKDSDIESGDFADDDIEILEETDSVGADDKDYYFSEEELDGGNHGGRRLKRGRKRSFAQWIILGIAIVIIGFVIVRVSIWNKGNDSDYDPNENNTEFDVEPSDYVQPLSAEQLKDKNDDGVTTILTIGNSPFADNYENNNLAAEIAKAYDATVINIGIEESYIAQKSGDYSGENLEDGVSLFQISKAINTGDYSIVRKAAANMSGEANKAAETLEATDMTKVDMIVIMYNLEDYKEHRPLGSSDNMDINCVYGAINKSLTLIQEKYPYIRIVMLSQPAAGVTIDDFYVDGDKFDIGEGTLSDYVTFELEAVASRGCSFIDLYYGAINVDNRDEYLVNDYHINDEGAKVIAARLKKLITL